MDQNMTQSAGLSWDVSLISSVKPVSESPFQSSRFRIAVSVYGRFRIAGSVYGQKGTEMAAEIVSKRGQTKLNHNGYLYLFQTTNRDETKKFWRCEFFGSNESLTSTTIDYQKENNNVFLVGIVFKKMKFRQSVLYEFADDSNLKLKYTKKDDDNLVDESDLLELENNQQLIKLIGNIDKHSLVTGDVIGVYGSQARMDDTFKVEMMILPEIPHQIPWPIIEKDCYIAFISGISLAGGSEKTAKTIQALNTFQKWVNNGLTLASHEKTDNIVNNLIRLEIQRQKVAAIGLEYESNLDCFTGLDTFICSLLEKLSIDVMPGANDPA
uniref:DNA polymerase delta subunit OB-fold domain-containing protein n=1 Tax=Meloidogyne javanica TaxID=6303 RepID=A0A915MLV7_MELJA